MNSLERVTKVLQFEEPDRVPVYPLVAGISRELIGADYKTWSTDADVCAKAFIKATEEFGLDMIATLIDLSVEAADFGAKLIFPENEAAHPVHDDRFIKSPSEYSKIRPINPRKTPRMKMHIDTCRKIVKAKGNETPIAAFIFGPLGILGMLRGQEDLFMELITNGEEVHTALEAINNTLIEYCDALIETGVHAIMIDTLYASKSIMSKRMWKKFEGVYVKKLAKHVHDKGCMFMIHNCGHGNYLDVQIDMMNPEAVSFLHLPDDCSSTTELKEKYGKKTVLIGHIDPPWLVSASEDEIREECRKQIEQYKKGGGFVLSTGCEFPVNADIRKVGVIAEAAREYGKY